MNEYEKVIMGLECLITNDVDCYTCPYAIDGYCLSLVAKDALDLIKKQKPIEPIKKINDCLCGSCRIKLYREYNYCPNCGKRIKWND